MFTSCHRPWPGARVLETALRRHRRAAGAPRRRCPAPGRSASRSNARALRQRLRLLNASDPLDGSAEVFLRRLRCDDPHRDGNRLLSFAGTLRAVGGMDDGRRLGGHGAIVGRSPDMKSRRGGGMLPVARRNTGSGGVDAVRTRAEGFYWVVLGQNPPEIAYWERREWWLAGDPTPWQPQAVTVVSDRLIFRPHSRRLLDLSRRAAACAAAGGGGA